MRLGDRGRKVQKLQEFLIKEGFLHEKEFNFSVKTKIAVIEAQKFCGIEATGEWNEHYDEIYEIKKNGQKYAIDTNPDEEVITI